MAAPARPVFLGDGFASTIRTGARLGYRRWPLVIFRTTYDDDAAWDKFMALEKSSALTLLREHEHEAELAPHLEWTVVEDRATLDGASKEEVRQRFREWVAASSVDRDGPGVDQPGVLDTWPRFRYCVCVDRACLKSITAEWHWRRYWSVQGEVVVIDGAHEHRDEPTEEEYEPIDGNTSFNVGWIYYRAGLLVMAFNLLQYRGTDAETWDNFCNGTRPSAAGPKPGRTQPLAALDLSRA